PVFVVEPHLHQRHVFAPLGLLGRAARKTFWAGLPRERAVKSMRRQCQYRGPAVRRPTWPLSWIFMALHACDPATVEAVEATRRSVFGPRVSILRPRISRMRLRLERPLCAAHLASEWRARACNGGSTNKQLRFNTPPHRE